VIDVEHFRPATPGAFLLSLITYPAFESLER
jgi:hypothetical protein